MSPQTSAEPHSQTGLERYGDVPKFRQWVLLRPIGLLAEELARRAILDEILWRWPSTPSIDAFYSVLHAPFSEHFAVVDTNDNSVVGHCAVYSLQMVHRTAFFEASLAPECRQGGSIAVGAIVLGIHQIVTRFDLRKLYLETTTDRLETFESVLGRGYFVEEAVLSDHVFSRGQTRDVHLLSARVAELRDRLERDWAPHFASEAVTHG